MNTYLSNHKWGVTVVLFSLLVATIAYVYTKSAVLLGGIVAVGVVATGLLASDWVAAGIIGVSGAVAGALGLLQDQRDIGAEPGDTDPPPESPLAGHEHVAEASRPT